jgi:hypothetical protein
MAKLTPPKKKKYPKPPKANADAQTWKRYEDKVAEINSDYEKRKADYERDLKAREKSKERVKDLKSGKKPR